MKTLRNIVLLLLFPLLGCEEVVDPDGLLTNTENPTVIYGFISPQDEFLKISVYRSESVIGQPIDPIAPNISMDYSIENAIVTLSDPNGNTSTLSYDQAAYNYQIAASEFPILAGQTYELKVVVGDSEFNATCTIPANRVEELSGSVRNGGTDETGEQQLTLRAKFLDVANVGNYYIVGGKIESRFDGENGFVTQTNANFKLDRFVTDEAADGVEYTAEGNFSAKLITDSNTFYIQVANVEQPLYQLLRTSYLNFENETNPFEESIIPPNNIRGENGFGVFAGFQLSELQLE